MTILTVDEILDLFKIGRTKLYELLRSGELPSFRVGKLYRVNLADVEYYVDNNRSA